MLPKLPLKAPTINGNAPDMNELKCGFRPQSEHQPPFFGFGATPAAGFGATSATGFAGFGPQPPFFAVAGAGFGATSTTGSPWPEPWSAQWPVP